VEKFYALHGPIDIARELSDKIRKFQSNKRLIIRLM
jgi:hypothetical protein